MFEPAIKHIEFTYSNHIKDASGKITIVPPVYSEIYYIEAVPNATLTASTASVNHSAQKARAIFMHFIYCEDTGAAQRYVDQYGNVLFQLPAASGGWAPIAKVTKGSQLRVTNTTGKPIFWIAYQYIL